jgi:hypothetical protein
LINEEGFRAIARKNMRASKPSNEIKNQVADQNLFWQSMLQRGNRIIVIDEFFATPFSKLLRDELK